MSTATLSVQTVPLPDSKGEFHTPADGAKFMASFGIPQTPLRGKAPFLESWVDKASTDFDQIDKWATHYPGCNFGSVAKATPAGFWVIDVDSHSMRERFQKETGKDFAAKLITRSKQGGHRWYQHSAESIALGNIGQKGTDFSVRVDGEQCVSPGSIHPLSGRQYRVMPGWSAPEVATPEEVSWLAGQRAQVQKVEAELSDDAPIPEGQRDSTLTSIAGRMRQVMKADEEQIYVYLSDVNDKRCNPPLDEDQVRKIAHSVSRYAVKDDRVLIGGVEAGTKPHVGASTSAIATVSVEEPEPEIDDAQVATWPEFPRWVMEGTSVYEGLVKPVVATSDKYPELIFMPGVLMTLNSIALHVRLKNNAFVPNMFLGVIGPYGHFFKSSSCKLAHQYFMEAGFAQKWRDGMVNAEGKTIITSIGSTEGLGLEMQRIQSHKAVLFYDELGKFISKAGIENSSIVDDFLSFYESGDFSNLIKGSGRKGSYAFHAGTYCFSWMWATTDRKFPGLWARLPNDGSGLNDRMFFMLTPQKEKEAGLYQEADTRAGAAVTKQVLSAAISQGVFDYEDYANTQQIVKGLDPRAIGLLERLSLYFAVDLGRSVIDDDCTERAKALVLYRNAVVGYLDPVEAESPLGKLQQEMTRELRRNGGKMKYRDFYHNLHADAKGTELWNRAWRGLVGETRIAVRESQPGRGVGHPKMVYLLKEKD